MADFTAQPDAIAAHGREVDAISSDVQESVTAAIRSIPDMNFGYLAGTVFGLNHSVKDKAEAIKEFTESQAIWLTSASDRLVQIAKSIRDTDAAAADALSPKDW